MRWRCASRSVLGDGAWCNSSLWRARCWRSSGPRLAGCCAVCSEQDQPARQPSELVSSRRLARVGIRARADPRRDSPLRSGASTKSFGGQTSERAQRRRGPTLATSYHARTHRSAVRLLLSRVFWPAGSLWRRSIACRGCPRAFPQSDFLRWTSFQCARSHRLSGIR